MKKLGVFLGCAIASLVILNTAPANAVVFFQDTFDSFSGDWAVSSTVVDGDAGIASDDTSPATSGNPYGYVEAAASILNTTTISRSISTVGYDNIGLAFYYKTVSANENLIDYTEFRWRKTGDLLWNVVDINNTEWTPESMVLPGVGDSSVDVAFSIRNVLSDDSTDSIYFDDLTLRGEELDPGQGPGPGPNPDPRIPEPATMLLFGTGLAGLAARSRRG